MCVEMIVGAGMGRRLPAPCRRRDEHEHGLVGAAYLPPQARLLPTC